MLRRWLPSLLVLMTILSLFPASGHAQCPNTNAQACTAFDGSGLGVGVRTFVCDLWGGDHQEITNLGAGNTYRVDFCGPTAPSYNSFMTVYEGGGALVSFNDGSCGTGDDADLTFVATTGGTYRVLADISGNCTAANTTNTPLHITLVSLGASPEMDVRGNSVSITDGDATPSATDHTDFGSVLTCTGTITRTFTVANTGTSSLNMNGVPKVVVGGANAADFTVSAQPVSPVSSGGTTTFTVVFNPSADGVRVGTLSIANDDVNENPYNFTIQGTGSPDVTSPTLTFCPGAQTVLANGSCQGIVPDYTSIVTATDGCGAPSILQLAPSAPGTVIGGVGSSMSVSVFARDAALNSSTCTFTVTTVSPEVNVQGNATSIADGDVTPTLTDHTDFGSQSVCSGTVVRTFTIQNTGTVSLTVTGLVISGTNAADFSITSSPGASVAAAGSTTFSIAFDPTALGVRTATLTFTTNDCDENPYNFSIQGTGTDAEANVQGNSVSIADGDVTPSPTDHTDFGNQSVCSGTVVRTYTIQNTGTSSLTVSGLAISGANAADFSITGSPGASVAAAGSTTFSITFDPSALGVRSATITFTTNDCDENPYNFSIHGSGTDPEVNVQGNSVSIADGDVTPTLTDHTDFGSQAVCSGTVVRTYRIQNTGSDNLSVSGLIISGTHAADFSIVSSPSATVAAAGSTSFSISFDPSAAGTRNATVTFANSDCDENPYNFAIQGTGADAEANVTGNSVSIADGDVTPTLTDHTDFGSQSVCSGTVVRTYSIQNTGTSSLTVSGLAISGTNAADFSISSSPGASVAAAGSTTFSISFDPTATGVRTATISFATNDCDENPYNFSIQGTGSDPEINLQGNAVSIANGDVTPSTADHTDFGSQSECSGTISRTFTIQNTGVTALAVGAITFTGTNAADFSVTSPPAASVAGAGTTTFIVAFNPSGIGLRSAAISIVNDDCNENPYTFAIQGTGTDPEVNLQGNTVSIANGDASPTVTDHTDFGSQNVCSGTLTRTFTIQNTGTSNLSVGAVTFTGANAADFSVTTAPSGSVAAAGNTAFTVSFDPSGSGLRSATVSIVNGDCNENPYTFAVQGTGTASTINLQGNSVSIADGDLSPSLSDHTDFGSVAACSGDIIRTFTIQNTGTLALSVSGITLTGAGASDYTLGGISFPASIAAAGSTTFTVTFDPAVVGSSNATVNISSDDCSTPAYDFAISGAGDNSITAPAITGAPQSTAVCDGSPVSFTVAATGGGLSYQWQENDGSGFANVLNIAIYSGANSATLNINPPPNTYAGYNYQCIVANACGTVTTTPVLLSINPVATIINQPSNTAACPGNSASFTINAVATNISYQWQEDSGSGFSNLANGGNYSGVNTATLVVNPVSLAMNGWQYRCIIGGDCPPNDTSAGAILSMFFPASSSAVTTDITCFGAADGAIDQTITGQGPFQFQWSNSALSEDLSNLAPGSYTCTITDINGCTTLASYLVNEPTALQGSVIATSGTCIGSADGCLDLTVSGGTAPYAYAWAGGSTAQDTCSLAPGNYDVTVTDANGCTAVYSGTVVGFPNPQPVIVLQGNSQLEATGGPFATYQWSDPNGPISGETNPSFSGDSTSGSHTYYVEVTDSNGCVGIDSITYLITGLNDPFSGLKLELHPNPASANLSVNVNGAPAGEMQMRLLDIQGRLLLTEDGLSTQQAFQLGIEQLANGVYFLQVAVEGRTLTQKFVKQ